MSIKFKCSCGKELDVPDETAGREAFCPGCRKSVPVPDESDQSDGSDGSDMSDGASPAKADEREASEFKPGALADLLGASSSGKSDKSDKSDRSDKSGSDQGAASARRKEERVSETEEVGRSIAAPEKSLANSSAPPDKPDISSVEVLPGKIKFRCECGQKVAVRTPAPQSAGKCPRCKRTLTVPSVPGVSDKQPRKSRRKRSKTSAKDLRHCAKCGRRIEDTQAAFCPRCGSPLESKAPVPERKKTAELPAAEHDAPPASPASSPAPRAPDPDVRGRSAREAAERAANLLRPPSRMKVPATGQVPELSVLGRPAGLGPRLASFLLDSLAGGGMAAGAYMLASRAELGAALVPAVLAAVAAFALVNEVIFAALTGGRSLGMLVSGVGVRNHEGQPAGVLLLLVRLLASTLLFIGAPLALFDAQRRTLHDIVCGTTVRRLSGG
jgi:uncharacterized RDD family membrane protein YckC